MGADADEEMLAQQEKMLAHIFDSQSDAFYTSGHMMDDGMIDPRNMRKTLGMLLETVREGRCRKLRPNSFGVARL
jgi:geranyl-CoA carboxylase beta subunit